MRLRDFEIDDQVEFRRLQDRQVCGLLALEGAADIDADSQMTREFHSPVLICSPIVDNVEG